jgi:hypothetical protein
MAASLQRTQGPTNVSGSFFPAAAGRSKSREKSSAPNGSSSGLQPQPERVERTPAREPSTSASFAERRPGSEPRRSGPLRSSDDTTRLTALRAQRKQTRNVISSSDIQDEIDALTSSISSASSEPRSSTKNDRIEPMVASDNEDGDKNRDGPPTPDLLSSPEQTMEYLFMPDVVNHQYQDDPQELGFAQQKPDPRGEKPTVTEATAENWKVPFPLSDGSNGEPEDKEPPLFNDPLSDQSDTEEPLHEGSSHSPPWLQRSPLELDGQLASCNPHAARKG